MRVSTALQQGHSEGREEICRELCREEREAARQLKALRYAYTVCIQDCRHALEVVDSFVSMCREASEKHLRSCVMYYVELVKQELVEKLVNAVLSNAQEQ